MTLKVIPIHADIDESAIYPKPKIIIGATKPSPYPLDALPELMQAAVRETQAYIQAPVALVACNALATACLATQGLAKVRRDVQLVSPLSLYIWLISEPNERKSFSESFFLAPVQRWVREQVTRSRAAWDRYEADKGAWESQIKAAKLAIQKAAKDSSELEPHKNALRKLVEDKPKRPIVPKLQYTDTTHQALTEGLMKYPVGGIITAEGGLFFGSAGLQADAITSALAIFNDLWSGNSVIVDRKGEGSLVLQDVVLMMNIAVQPEVLTRFLNRTGSLARGSGFLARPLLAMPETTQGTRSYQPPPEEWSALEQFNDRITELLNQLPEHVDEHGKLSRTTLNLSAEAKAVWVSYYNTTEGEQQVGGEAEFIRPEAGKSPDNASRIAAIFHILEHGLEGDISADHMQRACRVAEWHLQEAKRFLFASDMPEQFRNAQEVSIRIAAFCRKRLDSKEVGIRENWNSITRRQVLQFCKVAGVKDNKTLNPVIEELLEAHHLLSAEAEGRTLWLTVNPRLLEVHHGAG